MTSDRRRSSESTLAERTDRVALSRTTRDSRRQIMALLLEHGQLSRTELARLANLNKPTVSSRVAGLIDDGLVREVGSGVSTGGRKPILLEVRETSRVVAGIEFDATFCKVLLVSLTGETLAETTIPITETDVASVVDAVCEGIDAVLEGYSPAALLACGVAAPGLVDRIEDTVALPAPFNWSGARLRQLLEKRLGVPALITDRGKAAGLGEMWLLGKEQAHDLIYLYLGRGVAGAIVLGQEIHWGTRSIAGEIGHMVVDPAGPRCVCGSRGCLEALVSTGAIGDRLHALAPTYPDSTLNPTHLGAGELLPAIGRAGLDGDRLALAVIEPTARWIGLALASLINVLNPAAIVLGGPTTAALGDPLLATVRQVIDRSTLRPAREAVTVVRGQAHDRAATLGASALVLQRAPELLAQTRRTPTKRIRLGG